MEEARHAAGFRLSRVSGHFELLLLDRMAAGDFQIRDLEFYEGAEIALSLIRVLAWLCDVDVSHLEYRELYPASEKTAEDSEFYGGRSWLVEESPELTSLEICSGAGGAALGLHTAGFSSVGLIERNPHAVTTLLANRQLGPVIFNDVRQIDYTSYVGKIDLFAGGVPCQPHSVLGNQEGENDKRDLFAHSVELIRLIQPRAVMLENVSGFAHRQAALYRAQIFEGLRKAGYDAELFAISASDFGLAQARPRLSLLRCVTG